MAQADYFGAGSVTSYNTVSGASLTITLVGAGAQTFQRITDIAVLAIGTVTAYKVVVFKNDGSTYIASFGGQVGGAATGPMGPGPYNFNTPINCVAGDNAKVVVTATGASNLDVTVNYIFGAK